MTTRPHSPAALKFVILSSLPLEFLISNPLLLFPFPSVHLIPSITMPHPLPCVFHFYPSPPNPPPALERGTHYCSDRATLVIIKGHTAVDVAGATTDLTQLQMLSVNLFPPPRLKIAATPHTVIILPTKMDDRCSHWQSILQMFTSANKMFF